MIDLLATIAIFFGAVAYFIDSLSLKIRLTSGIVGRVAIFNHMSMVAMMLNRLAVSLTLPILGFLIDSGLGYERIIYIVTAGIFLYLMLNLILLVFSSRITKIILYFLRYYSVQESKSDLQELYNHKNSINLLNFDKASIFAYTIIILGFFLPSVLAAAFFDYRASIIQLGFSLNVFGTLVNVLVIEKNVSQIIEKRNIAEVINLTNRILIGRFYGALIAGITVYSAIYIL
tara:strand:+ start:7547 stop:8239 length:693 start_codon:yes stop_codon:yes gene_type:complete